MLESKSSRRDLFRAGAAAFTTSIFTGKVKGANDRLAGAVIGIGKMGRENLKFALRQPGVEVVAICDVYQPHLEDGLNIAAKFEAKPKTVKDFRQILEDKSIDFVNISAPDHWHAYMTVEASKRGKDVYVEKPLCTHVDEGKKMVEAARRYKRVVQAGTMQRSGDAFQKAAEIVKSGQLGKITLVRTWINALSKQEGIGNPPDSDPPPGLDWDLWLGPAPKRAFNANRWGVHPEMGGRSPFPYFRYFWDYAGGMMTDWGVHLLDPMHQSMDEPMPLSVSATGGKFWLEDNRETPDTLTVTYEYPGKMVVSFETLSGSFQSPFPAGPGTLFCGTQGQLYVSRGLVKLIPERGSTLEPLEIKPTNNMNMAHWANFIECIRSRQQPTSDVERCFKTTTACILGNLSYRSRRRLDWDAARQTVVQKEARRLLAYNYRKPWKLEV
jgi:predicted dehydrogenase